MTMQEALGLAYFLIGGYVTGHVWAALMREVPPAERPKEAVGWLLLIMLIWLTWPLSVGVYHADKWRRRP